MKNIIKLLGIVLVAAFCSVVQAQNYVTETYAVGATGTTSATVVIPKANGFLEITDLIWDVDNTITSATVDIRAGDIEYAVASATSGSGTVLWFTNTGTAVAVGEYVLFYDESLGTYTMVRVNAATTTSVTCQETISVATTVLDKVFSLKTAVRRNAPDITTSSTVAGQSIWLPSGLPSAITIDGNTTACKIEASGIRTLYR